MMKMLIVERDPVFSQAWQELFEKEHFHVDVVESDVCAKDMVQQGIYDVIILSSNLPEIDAIDFCRTYRAGGGSTPIMLTAESKSSVQLENGLDAGADDYLVKPVKLRDLNARIRALLRRPPALCSEVLEARHLILDVNQCTVFIHGEELHLHPMELNLLEFFLRHQNHTFTCEALLERVWQGRTNASIGTVRTHIKTLRRKLQEREHGSMIVTVRGRGYKLVS
jgi:DNA-binding response OmpR family regulator